MTAAVKSKMGRPRKSDVELRASGSHLLKERKKKSPAEKKPKAWKRELPGDDAILDPVEAIKKIPGFDPYRDAGDCMFDADAARKAVAWIHRYCTHAKGSLGGTAYVLDEIEQAIIFNLFGWRHKEDHTRRFRKGFIYVPRKWGKTLFASAVALMLLLEQDAEDDYAEEGVEAYCAAAARDQAKLLWNIAKRMVQNDEYLSERVRVYQHSMARIGFDGDQDGSYFQSISSEANTAHGFNPQVWVLDELHAQSDGDLLDVLDTGTASRSQPLALMITTADFERESICNEEHDYAKKVRDGIIEDPQYLPVIFEASVEDDWEDEAVWSAANPKYPATPTQEYMQSMYRKAKSTPRFLNTFKRLHLNIKTGNCVQWLPMDKWDACDGLPGDEVLKVSPCFAGLDLASTYDVAACVLYWPELCAVRPHFWIPGSNARDREKNDKVPYTAWAREGLLKMTDGDVIDYETIEADIMDLGQNYNIRGLGADRWNLEYMRQKLAKAGVEIVGVGQGFASLSSPSKELEKLVVGQQLQHGGHKVLRWMANNAQAEIDHAGNIKPSKKKSTEKIDGIVALVMAIAMSMAGCETDSVYNSEDRADGLMAL